MQFAAIAVEPPAARPGARPVVVRIVLLLWVVGTPASHRKSTRTEEGRRLHMPKASDHLDFIGILWDQWIQGQPSIPGFEQHVHAQCSQDEECHILGQAFGDSELVLGCIRVDSGCVWSGPLTQLSHCETWMRSMWVRVVEQNIDEELCFALQPEILFGEDSASTIQRSASK